MSFGALMASATFGHSIAHEAKTMDTLIYILHLRDHLLP